MRTGRRRRWVVALGLAFAVITGGGAEYVATGHNGSTPATARSSAPVETATVQRTTLTSRSSVTGTLGYQGSYTVASATGGVLTTAPAIGSLVTRGQPIFSVNDSVSYLLYGAIPAWRGYTTWSSPGPDIAQLSSNLAAMGYLPASQCSDRAGWDITEAVQSWQRHLGVPVTGELRFGQIVFAPQAIRVTALNVDIGTSVMAGGALVMATSTIPGVTAMLDPATAAPLRAGNPVLVTTPDGRRRPAIITSIATVASSTPSSTGSSPTVSVPIAITFTPRWTPPPSAIDQAPVTVAITVRRVADVLAVPVTALLATTGGGYVVELNTGTPHQIVPVTPGLFDDISGLVQVSGALRAGQVVVVAAS